MTKKRSYSREKIERSLAIVDKKLKEGNPLRASRALTVAFNYARDYEGPDKNNYLERIRQNALTIGQDKSLKDYEYEPVQDIEDEAEVLLKARKSNIEGLLLGIIVLLVI